MHRTKNEKDGQSTVCIDMKQSRSHLTQKLWWGAKLVFRKVKQRWQWLPVRKTSRLFTKLVKERMRATFERLDPPLWRVGKGGCNKIHGIFGRFVPKDLFPLTSLDLRELELNVIGIHRANFFPCRCAQDLDDLD